MRDLDEAGPCAGPVGLPGTRPRLCANAPAEVLVEGRGAVEHVASMSVTPEVSHAPMSWSKAEDWNILYIS